MSSSTPPESRMLFKLLGDDLYWSMLAALARSDMRLSDLAVQLGRTPHLVEQNLAALHAAGLVVERQSDARSDEIYYQLSLNELRRQYRAAGLALHPELGDAEAPMMPQGVFESAPTRVLFLCTHNSARSQMAEGLLRMLGGHAVEVFSAGTSPTSIHPHTIAVMQSLKIDIGIQRSKHLDEFADQRFDYVITVCDKAREACPTFANAGEQLHWSIPDPLAVAESAQYEAFRQISTILTTRIRYLLILIQRDREQPAAV